MEKFGRFAFEFLIGSLALMSRGYVAMTLWVWFVVPRFHVPGVDVWFAALFLWCLRGLMVSSGKFVDEDWSKDVARQVAAGIVVPWLVLGICWIGRYL